VLFTLTAILFLTFLDTTIMSVALADLQSSLSASVSETQWVVNSYALLFATLMLAFGSLGDRVGRKRVMLSGVVVFMAGSLSGALAPNVESLIAARAVMGIGAAACEPGTLSIIRQVYTDGAERARALGLWAAVAGLALAMGPVLGGVLVGLGGWPAIFWFNLVAGAVVLAAAISPVPESSDPEPGRFDLAGFILGPVALGTVVFAIIVGETAGYFASHVLALFAVGVVATGLFVLAERRNRAPMLRIDYMRKLPFTGSLWVAFDLLPDGTLPADRAGLLGLSNGGALRAHGSGHDRCFGFCRQMGRRTWTSPTRRARLPGCWGGCSADRLGPPR